MNQRVAYPVLITHRVFCLSSFREGRIDWKKNINNASGAIISATSTWLRSLRRSRARHNASVLHRLSTHHHRTLNSMSNLESKSIYMPGDTLT